MPNNQRLKEIIKKLRLWSEESGDEVLDSHINELELEINATFDAGDDADDTGGSTPNPDKGRG